ncbi:hypothetical protein GWI33_002720 [Rhynchophorus ferrugineus]|uniref:Uncharacterized protein n=1 Tax=Rhynchophorus ferrugineus TaxID=354439 RepID=A0A834MHH2_RHYFE|nr:hypothetical protein GWI33_002720 [Rhynchophorus ferrugineus]
MDSLWTALSVSDTSPIPKANPSRTSSSKPATIRSKSGTRNIPLACTYRARSILRTKESTATTITNSKSNRILKTESPKLGLTKRRRSFLSISDEYV